MRVAILFYFSERFNGTGNVSYINFCMLFIFSFPVVWLEHSLLASETSTAVAEGCKL